MKQKLFSLLNLLFMTILLSQVYAETYNLRFRSDEQYNYSQIWTNNSSATLYQVDYAIDYENYGETYSLHLLFCIPYNSQWYTPRGKYSIPEGNYPIWYDVTDAAGSQLSSHVNYAIGAILSGKNFTSFYTENLGETQNILKSGTIKVSKSASGNPYIVFENVKDENGNIYNFVCGDDDVYTNEEFVGQQFLYDGDGTMTTSYSASKYILKMAYSPEDQTQTGITFPDCNQDHKTVTKVKYESFLYFNFNEQKYNSDKREYFIPSGYYSIDRSNSNNTVSIGDGEFVQTSSKYDDNKTYKYTVSSTALYQEEYTKAYHKSKKGNGYSTSLSHTFGGYFLWCPTSGEVCVINPNHSQSPLYVSMSGISSRGQELLVTSHESLPGKFSLTVSTVATGANGSASISCAEGHGYANSTGTDLTYPGNYYYNGTTVTLVAPNAQDGYRFTKWTKGSSSTSLSTKTSYQFDVSSTNSGAYVANFEGNSYTVHFDGNDNTGGSMSDQTGFKYGTGKALTSNAFSRAYIVTYDYHDATSGNGTESNTATYTFNGWNTAANGNGISYTNGYSLSTPSPIPSHNGTVNLYAQWTPASVSVTLPSPEKTGHKFLGWYTEETGGTPVGGADDSYTPTEGIILHAQWQVNTYNIYYKDKGNATYSGNNVGSLPTSHTYNEATDLVDGTKDAFTFLGWFTDENCTVSAGTSIAANSIAADITLYAKWELAATPEITLNEDGSQHLDNGVATSADLSSKYAGRDVNVTLNRQLYGGSWNTICFPFSVEDLDVKGNELYDILRNSLYELQPSTTTATADGMIINFLPLSYEEGVIPLKAGVPYLIRTSADIDLADYKFENVRLNPATNPVLKKEGVDLDVQFIPVMTRTLLTSKKDIVVVGSRLYYPNQSGGSYLRAFRAYLHITNGAESNYVQPRIRIVDTGEIIALDEEQEVETRKYIEDGILIIERGGVRYDAQGKRME